MITGESRPVPRGPRRPGRRRHRQHRLRHPGAGHRGRRRHHPRRHPRGWSPRPRRRAAGPRCSPTGSPPSSSTSTTAAGRRSPSSPGPLAGDLDAAVTSTVTVLVIACPHALGPRHPPRRRHLDLAVGPQRDPREGPHGPRADAPRRRRAVRQDGHAHRRRPRRHRRRWPRPAARPSRGARPRRCGRGRQRAPARPAIVSPRHRRRARCRPPPSSARGPGAASRPTVDGARYTVGGPTVLREIDADVPAEHRGRRPTAWADAGRIRAAPAARRSEVLGALALEDQIRPRPDEAVSRAPGRSASRSAMITGDARSVAESRGPRASGLDAGRRRGPPRGQGPGGRRPPGPRAAASPWSATA